MVLVTYLWKKWCDDAIFFSFFFSSVFIHTFHTVQQCWAVCTNYLIISILLWNMQSVPQIQLYGFVMMMMGSIYREYRLISLVDPCKSPSQIHLALIGKKCHNFANKIYLFHATSTLPWDDCPWTWQLTTLHPE